MDAILLGIFTLLVVGCCMRRCTFSLNFGVDTVHSISSCSLINKVLWMQLNLPY